MFDAFKMFGTLLKPISSHKFLRENFRYIYPCIILNTKSDAKKTDTKICPPTNIKPPEPLSKTVPDSKECGRVKDGPKKEEVKATVDSSSKEKSKKAVEEEEEISTEPLFTTNYDNSRVVIIGAGIAGIAAAKYLEENNIKNYVILEALGRIGGRIQTEWFGDTIAELGSRCPNEGGEFSTFIQAAMADGLLTGPITHTSLFLNCEGRSVNEATSLIAYEIFKNIYCESRSLDNDKFDYINFRIEQELSNFPNHLKQDAARVILGLFAMLQKKGDNIPFISNQGSGTFLQIPGGTVKVALGYCGLLHPMIQSIPHEKIKLNKPVQNIRWGAVVCKDTPRVIVKCCDGSVYPADYVIITVSLGVLQRSSDTLFCPALPADKVDAMRKLGFNHLDNAYLRFSQPIWSWANEYIDFEYDENHTKSRTDWTRAIVNISQIIGSNNVLRVKIAGDGAPEFEKLDHSTISKGVMKIIKKEMKLNCLPTVVDILRSTWSNNVYFHGAFSCLPEGVQEETQHKLAEPLPGNNAPVSPILFFAGEATCPKLYGTAQGARISGIREASRVKRTIASNMEVPSKNKQKIAVTG